MGTGVSSLGRFSEAGLFILVSLAEGEKHGYGILTDVRESFGVRLGIGTLYQAIERLEDRGLIEALPSTNRRRPYRLTPAGAAELRNQLSSLQHVVASGMTRLERA
jgi:DNA-binding PadR family transcriptional regulator